MHLKVLFLCLMAVGFGCVDDNLHEISHCGSPCITLENEILVDEQAVAATCHTGKMACPADGEPYCEGGILPLASEVCDPEGRDDDCNPGTPDSGLQYGPENSINHCSETELGVCRESPVYCIGGNYVCVNNNLKKDYETCSGLDEDCDGLYDADDPDLVLSGPHFYYPEDIITTANVGECSIGVRRCVESHEVIEGLITPREEICDYERRDEDCDGFNNEDETNRGAAFLLVVDYSGSMLAENRILLDTLCDWATEPMFINSQFAIMAIGKGDVSTAGSVQVSNFASPADACYNSRIFSNGGYSDEYITRGIVLGFEEEYTWPEDMKKHVLFFTDELPANSRQSLNGLSDKQELALLCASEDLDVGGFIFDHYEAAWTSEVSVCGGWIESVRVETETQMSLEESRMRLRAALERRFVPTCD